jgi:hypothetical protein
MLRAILGAGCGLVLGGLFGVGLLILTVLGEGENWADRAFMTELMVHVNLGAGFGAVTGAIVGATGAIVHALRLPVYQPPPPPAR